MLESNSMKKIISYLLSNPILFNSVRRTIAGNQENTKNFVRSNLQIYKAKKVLDVGCGTGEFSDALPEDFDYTGVDINIKYITFAQKNYKNAKRKFLIQDITDRHFFENQRYEATLLISMLHHLSDAELEKILPIIKRVTTKIVIVADIIPDPQGLLRKLMVKMDQGKFVRSREDKIKILCKYFKIIRTAIIPSRLAVQFGIVCKV